MNDSKEMQRAKKIALKNAKKNGHLTFHPWSNSQEDGIGKAETVCKRCTADLLIVMFEENLEVSGTAFEKLCKR